MTDEIASGDERQAERNRSMIEHGRRIGGLPGAMMAGSMIALRDVFEVPKDDKIVATAEAPTEPEDVDADGIQLSSGAVGGEADVEVPAQERRPPIVPRRRR